MLPLNEINHKPVAYAVTEESAKNYFMNGKDYDWDSIKAWYKAGDDFHDNYHATSPEYDFLACRMKDMSDIEIERLTDAAEFSVDKKGSVYQLSDKLDILADRRLTHMNIDRVTNCMGNIFDSFHEWYTDKGIKSIQALHTEMIEEHKYKSSEIDAWSIDELEQHLAEG